MKDNSEQAHVLKMEENHLSKRARWLLLAGIFLVSSGMLAFEVTMTRLLSVMLSYHYVFAVISLALLGLGLGAIFVQIFGKKMPRDGVFGALPLLASLFALSVPLSVIVITGVAYSEALRESILLYLLVASIPFFFAGILLAELFRSFPSLSSRLYGMDLLGAATGAVGAVIALNSLGGLKTIFVIGSLALVAALLYTIGAFKNLKRLLPVTTCLLLVVSLASSGLVGYRLPDIPTSSSDKEMNNLLNEPSLSSEVIESRWSAFGRTDLVAFNAMPDQMAIFLDGAAGAPMYRFNGDVQRPDPQIESLKTEFPGFIALSSFPKAERNNALIIGPGGGRDILLALMAGVDKITAVEVNPDMVDIVRQYGSYNGDILGFKNVTTVVDEGRSFLKRQQEKYDVIMLSLPITKTGRSAQGFALTENFLFTTESINDYLNHLTDEGRIVVVAHDQIEIVRLLSISLAALRQRGIESESAMKQISVLGSHHFPAFVLKKTPFATAGMVAVHESIHQLGYDLSSSYLPAIKLNGCSPHEKEPRFDQCDMFSPLFVATSLGKVNLDYLKLALAQNGLDISPVTDDSPFFYKMEPGIPQPVSVVLWSSLGILVVTTAAFLIRRRNKLYRHTGGASGKGNLLELLALFSMLGIGFMLAEIAIFQRFMLFLGQPVISLAVLLSSLLSGAGIGSLFSGRFPAAKIPRVLVTVSPVIAGMLLVYAFLLPLILREVLGLEFILRLLITVALLAPLGFVMGFPFPLGMRLLKEQGLEDSIPWMWGLNGIGSVVGSALTIVVAISFGFTQALVLGAICYFVIFIVSQYRLMRA